MRLIFAFTMALTGFAQEPSTQVTNLWSGYVHMSNEVPEQVVKESGGRFKRSDAFPLSVLKRPDHSPRNVYFELVEVSHMSPEQMRTVILKQGKIPVDAYHLLAFAAKQAKLAKRYDIMAIGDREFTDQSVPCLVKPEHSFQVFMPNVLHPSRLFSSLAAFPGGAELGLCTINPNVNMQFVVLVTKSDIK